MSLTQTGSAFIYFNFHTLGISLMNFSCTRSLALLLALSSAVLVSQLQADPLPGRDILKFSQLPMVSTPIADPIIPPNPNLVAPAALPIGGITNYGGHDEISTVYGFHGPFPTDVPGAYTGRFMADDFSDKLNTPVVHVKWWGSYFADYAPEPVNQFLISFESDQPADAANSFSHPAQPLLNQVVNRGALAPGSGTFTEKLVRGPDAVRHESLYEYNAELYLNKPFPEKADNVYWLKIAAMVDVYPGFDNFNPLDPEHPPLFTGDHPTIWGWHNRDYTIQDTLASTAVSPGEHLDGTINGSPVYHFQDDAVTGNVSVNMLGPGGRVMPDIAQTNMAPTFYLDGADGPAAPAAGTIGISHYSKDLAFQLFTTNVPEPGACCLFLVGCVGVVALRRRWSDGRGRRLFVGSMLFVAMAFVSAAQDNAATIVFNNIAPSPQYYHNFGSSIVTLELSPEIGGAPSAPIWTGNANATSTFGQLTTLTGIGGGNFLTNQPRFALRVGVNRVPGPSSLALAAFGLVATGCFTNWLKRGPSPAADVTSARTTHKRSARFPGRSESQCTTRPACSAPAATDRELSQQSAKPIPACGPESRCVPATQTRLPAANTIAQVPDGPTATPVDR